MAKNSQEILSEFNLTKDTGKFLEIENVLFLVVADCEWKKVTGGKLQPSQSVPDGKDSFAMVKESYFAKNEFYWIEHEVGHCKYYFLHPEIGNEYLPYPDNEVERFAFHYQFTAMKKAGLSKNDAFLLIKKAYTESKDWGHVAGLEEFLKEMVDKAYAEN